jgi:hypothetical protein
MQIEFEDQRSPGMHDFVADVVRVTERMDRGSAGAGITLRVSAATAFVVRTAPAQRSVEFSAGAIDRLRASTAAYWHFYQSQLAGNPSDGRVLDLTSINELQRSLALLRWSVSAEGSVPRPHGLDDLNRDASRSAAVFAASLLLLHELAHIELGHSKQTPGADAIDQERDADVAALNALLASAAATGRRELCILGAADALLHLTATGIHSGDHDGRVHPRSFDRMFHRLRDHCDEDDEIWAVVAAMVSLHMQAMELDVPSAPFERFFDFVNAAVDVLSRTPDAS